MTEYVIRGNSAIMKCSIPSYIAEFVTVEAWIREDGETYLPKNGESGIHAKINWRKNNIEYLSEFDSLYVLCASCKIVML